MISKNVLRSMKTDIKNKQHKAAKLRGEAENLETEVSAMHDYLMKNSPEYRNDSEPEKEE